MRELNDETRREMHALNDETLTHMRVLHEEVLSRIASLDEHMNGGTRSHSTPAREQRRKRRSKG